VIAIIFVSRGYDPIRNIRNLRKSDSGILKIIVAALSSID
jgi:hypothetical protein